MKKGKLIQLRISEREKNIIQEKANAMEMSISDYIRNCSLNKKINRKINFAKMKECINDIDYSITQDDESNLFFVNNENKLKLKEDIRNILIYFDEQKGYFLEDGRSIIEVIEK